MSLTRRHFEAGAIAPEALGAALDKYLLWKPTVQPIGYAAAGYGNPAGTTGAANLLKADAQRGAPGIIEYHVKGAGQTILIPTFGANGLDIALDKTDDEGAEYVPGWNSILSRFAFTVGSMVDVFLRGKFKIADVSGTDEFLLGWRKQQAYATVHTSYTDYAAICIVTAANPAVVKTKTRLNTGTASVVDSGLTWADGAIHTWEVRVINGKARFLVDGAQVNAGEQFTFDSGDVLIPFIFYLHATTTPGEVDLLEIEVGPLEAQAQVALS